METSIIILSESCSSHYYSDPDTVKLFCIFGEKQYTEEYTAPPSIIRTFLYMFKKSKLKAYNYLIKKGKRNDIIN